MPSPAAGDQPPEALTPDGVPESAGSVLGGGEPFAGNPEYAWKALLLVLDWITQAQIKAGGSIAGPQGFSAESLTTC